MDTPDEHDRAYAVRLAAEIQQALVLAVGQLPIRPYHESGVDAFAEAWLARFDPIYEAAWRLGWREHHRASRSAAFVHRRRTAEQPDESPVAEVPEVLPQQSWPADPARELHPVVERLNRQARANNRVDHAIWAGATFAKPTKWLPVTAYSNGTRAEQYAELEQVIRWELIHPDRFEEARGSRFTVAAVAEAHNVSRKFLHEADVRVIRADGSEEVVPQSHFTAKRRAMP
jgi:hypothetical protein